MSYRRPVQPSIDVVKEQEHTRCYRNETGENYPLDSDLLQSVRRRFASIVKLKSQCLLKSDSVPNPVDHCSLMYANTAQILQVANQAKEESWSLGQEQEK